MSYRVGIGYDIHRLVEGRRLVIGGVCIDFPKGLLGHSDADVLIHAICDAILGACGEPDIGALFPHTARETEGMDSMDMLRQIVLRIGVEYEIVNIDANCICERPKLSPYRDGMIANIAGTCGLDLSRVSVKFRTNEGLGEIGSGDAIAAQAVVLLGKPASQGAAT